MWTNDNIPDQSGKTVIVTGANAGIGFETALALYKKGAHIILACRNLKNAEDAIARIKVQKGPGTMEAVVMDLSSLQSVKKFAENFIQKYTQLDILINNAGVMIPPAAKTAEGYELQFGVNFLGHFALSGYLYPLLKTTPASRIVTLSSLAYLHGTIDFDNLKSENSYDPMCEYCQSKLANLIFTLELQRRIMLAGDKVLSVAAQPGANKTELSRHMSDDEYAAAVCRVGELMDPWQGALPSLRAAVAEDVKGGELYGPDKDGGYRGFPVKAVITPNALDEAVAQKLWAFAEDATGVYYPRM